ncbi:MAG: DUF3667 domain-containing protein, partial [Gammaproteobacteria bacterium]|nr:DUF3667 domain-containing protein [Gammaproteobacteria bacterium]
MTAQTNCPNCTALLHGEYCADCGQHQKGIDRFFLSLVNEAFEDIFSLNSRSWRTVSALLFKPGYLSNEYFRGRRARYVSPIRLYFITSIAFFVLLSIANFFTPSEDPVIDQATTVDSGRLRPDQLPGTTTPGFPGAAEQATTASSKI